MTRGRTRIRSDLLLSEKGITAVTKFQCPERAVTSTVKFINDTGSSRSFLSWEDSLRMGIDPGDLPGYPKPIQGFGGVAEARHLKSECRLFIQFDEKHLLRVDLPDGILVWRVPPRKGRVPPGVSIMGREALRLSKWMFVVNLAEDEAYFETQ